MIPTYLKVPFSMKCSIHVFGLCLRMIGSFPYIAFSPSSLGSFLPVCVRHMYL